MKKKTLLTLVALLAAVASRAAEDAFEFFQEEAQVVTASRRPEPAWRAPAAVDVVTAEDIKAYGFKEIWDALRYRAGMDVIDGTSLDGNRALVSARGFDQEFVAEMLVLIDGRSAYSPFLGGVYWESLPVQMQDIERIEIVRGPNAALYGSNAGLGVINIITKKPGKKASATASVWAGNREGAATAAAVEGGAKQGAARVSFDYRTQDGDPTPAASSPDNNFLNVKKVNGRSAWTPDAKTRLELFGGASWMTAGLPGLATNPPAHHLQNFQMLRADRELDAGGVELSVARSEATIRTGQLYSGSADVRTAVYDAEALHRRDWLDGRLKSTWGAGWRLSQADSDQAFAGSPRQNYRLLRGFLHDSWRATERLTMVVGVSLEHSGTAGTQPAWQAAAQYEAVVDEIFRVSYSQAPTLPPLFDKTGNYLLTPAQRVVGNPNLERELLTSWEVGWNGRLLDGALRPSLAVYLLKIHDGLFNFQQSAGPVSVNSIDNRNTAYAHGAEASLDYVPAPGRAVFMNYSIEHVSDTKGSDSLGTNYRISTPTHKFNIGGRTALGRGVLASALLGYKDAYTISSTSRGTSVNAARSFRLDARVGWSPVADWELFIAGQNLLQPYTVEYADGVGNPRTVRAGVEAKVNFVK
jgi:iron complex outermembrane receptor protein